MTIKQLLQRVSCLAIAVSLAFSFSVFADSESNPEPQGTLSSTVKTGDTDNDGAITAADVLAIIRMASGTITKQPLNLAAGDINGDGDVSVRDALVLLKHIAKIETAPAKLGIENAEAPVYKLPEMYEKDSAFLNETALGFYGADGYGKYTTGGRGGTVYEVTNLNDSGPGSLSAACEAYGRRIVVFKVSGVINTIDHPIRITNGDITIAGETAPGDGICIASNSFTVDADNVIIRYMTFRSGDTLNAAGKYTGSEMGVGVDAMTVTGSHVIIDHCSTGWGTDETFSVTHKDDKYPTDISVQWCTVAESLVRSPNIGKELGLASLIYGAEGSRYSFHHNIYASHRSRMPGLGNDCNCGKCTFSFEFYNNVVYNWDGTSSGKCAQLDETGKNLRVINADFVNNYYIPGPDSDASYIYSEAVFGNSLHAAGNMMNGQAVSDIKDVVVFEDDVKATGKNPYYNYVNPETGTADHERYYDYDHSDGFWRTDRLADSMLTHVQPAEDAYTDVMLYAGHSLSRDTLDTGLIEGIRNKTGKCINSPFEAAGWSQGQPPTDNGKDYAAWMEENYPKMASYPAYTDSDHDGMSDAWEDFMKLDKNNAQDAGYKVYTDEPYAGSGYTNLDVFLQFLVENPAAAIKLDK